MVNSYKHCITHSAISYLLKVNRLQKDYFGGASAGKLYDRVVALTQDITVSLNSEKRLFSHRYLMSPHALLSSHRYLISPRTRFSLGWRMTVTNCLMLEIFRLCASHHLSGTFSISLAQIIGRLLVECKAPEQTKNHLKHITTQIKKIDVIFSRCYQYLARNQPTLRFVYHLVHRHYSSCNLAECCKRMHNIKYVSYRTISIVP